MALGTVNVPTTDELRADPAQFWSRLPADAVGLDLPADRRRAAAGDGGRTVAHLAGPVLGNVPQTGPDMFATLLAAWCAVLHRHTGQTDLVVGIRGGFIDRDLTDSVPPGITLPVRILVDPKAAFKELVEGTRQALSSAARHADVLDATGPGSIWQAAAPGVRVGFGILPPGGGEGVLTSVSDATDTAIDLELLLSSDGSDAIPHLVYNAGLFNTPTMARLLRHWAHLSAEAGRAPDVQVRLLPVEAGAAEPPSWDLPVPPGYRTPAPPRAGESLVDRFRAVVAQHGDRPAITSPGVAFSYAELERTARSVSRRLPRTPADAPVAVLCDHNAYLAVGVWAALMAGRGYVPLDPRQPDGRLARIVADAQVCAIISESGSATRAGALAKGKPTFTLPARAIEPGADIDTDQPNAADALAYLLYTSGSTGRPKGVVQSHENVLAHALTYAERLRIGPGDRVPLLARFTFDAAVMDFFGALLTGASLRVIEPVQPAVALWRELAEADVSLLHCTPTLFRHLLSDTSAGDGLRAKLRAVVLGGEAVHGDDLRRFEACFPEPCALVNGLGPTECTIALQYLARRGDPAAEVTVPVGHPVKGVEVRLVDADGLPTEVFGELEFAGSRLALGYLRQQEATASAFGVRQDGTRYYRTGDLARRLPDGSLVHCGRKDRQVKIRGFRIEPGEVEAVLRAHPTVAQAAVVVDDADGPARLIAYASSSTPAPLDPLELAGYLGRQLPDYAVPLFVVPVAVMPLGPTGKLDASRLPRPRSATADAAPSGSLERAVAGLWCRVLGLAQVGRLTNFMAAGGDSIRLMELLALAEAEFGVALPVVRFLRSPTVAAMAELIERIGKE